MGRGLFFSDCLVSNPNRTASNAVQSQLFPLNNSVSESLNHLDAAYN